MKNINGMLKKSTIILFIIILCFFELLYLEDAVDMIFVHPFEHWGSESFSEWWYYKSPILYLLRAFLDISICLLVLCCILKYHKKYFGRIFILMLGYLLWIFKYPIEIWIKHLFWCAIPSQRDYTEAYKQSHRENMPVDRYKAIRQLYFDAEKEMQYKKKFGRWN